jgi:hypothetical protein
MFAKAPHPNPLPNVGLASFSKERETNSRVLAVCDGVDQPGDGIGVKGQVSLTLAIFRRTLTKTSTWPLQNQNIRISRLKTHETKRSLKQMRKPYLRISVNSVPFTTSIGEDGFGNCFKMQLMRLIQTPAKIEYE